MIKKSEIGTWAAVATVMLATLGGGAASGHASEPAPLVVVYNKARVLHLPKAAHRVVVGNPAIADVNMESPTLVYIFGKAPGETSLVMLGDDDRAILSRPVVVTSQAERMVTVHLPGGDGPSSRAYSCVGNRCLHVSSPDAASASGAPSAAALTAAGGGATEAPLTGEVPTGAGVQGR